MIIKQYVARLGTVTIEEYNECGRTEYKVEHSYKPLCAYEWTDDKFEALKYAQFLAGKY